MKRNRQASGIPNLDKTLEVYEREGVTMPTGLTFGALASCDFIEKRQNLVMMGVPGSGKTHLASALGIKACDLGYKVMFRRMANLIEELQTAHDNHAWPRYRRRIEQCDLLIIDEWGYLPTNGRDAAALRGDRRLLRTAQHHRDDQPPVRRVEPHLQR